MKPWLPPRLLESTATAVLEREDKPIQQQALARRLLPRRCSRLQPALCRLWGEENHDDGASASYEAGLHHLYAYRFNEPGSQDALEHGSRGYIGDNSAKISARER